MSNDLYPALPGLTWPVKRTLQYNNVIQPSDSGYETRLALFRNPVYHWDLVYAYLKDDSTNLTSPFTASDFQTLLGFYMKHKGSFDDFLYFDTVDNIGLAMPLQDLQDTLGTHYSPLQRTIGSSGIAGMEDVTDLNPNLLTGGSPHGLIVYENGTPSTNWVLSGPGLSLPGGTFDGLYLVWNSAPTTPVTADIAWLYRTRFEKDDDIDFEWFLADPNRFKLNSVKLMTARRAPLI